MNRDYMLRMSERELDEYARSMGFSAHAAKGAAAKADLIERRRGRVAEVEALGVTVSIPVKAVADKRLTDALEAEGRSDADIEGALRRLLGDEQFDALVAAATEEDGTVDNHALGFAFNRILTSDELKNF